MSKYKMMKLRIITKVCIVFRECQKKIEGKALPYVYVHTACILSLLLIGIPMATIVKVHLCVI